MICKNCGSEAKIVVADLGFAPPSNSFLSKIDLNEGETYFPLKVFLCEQCLLVQMDEYKNAKEIFAKNYVYFSSYITGKSPAYCDASDTVACCFGYCPT